MTDSNDKSTSRGISKDMSPEAILKRLAIASRLRDFVRFVQTAKLGGRVEPKK